MTSLREVALTSVDSPKSKATSESMRPLGQAVSVAVARGCWVVVVVVGSTAGLVGLKLSWLTKSWLWSTSACFWWWWEVAVEEILLL